MNGQKNALMFLFLASLAIFNPINSYSMINGYTEINDIKEYQQVQNNTKPTVVMFSSTTSNPCNAMKPAFNAVASQFPNVSFYVVNTAAPSLKSLIDKFNILTLPTVVMSYKGKEIRRDCRGCTKAEIVSGVRELLGTIFPKTTTTGYIEINDITAYQQLEKDTKPTVVMFSSPTCNPCNAMKPAFNAVASQFPNVSFYVVNTAAQSLKFLVDKFNILGLPTVVMCHNGKEIRRDRRGCMTKPEIVSGVREFLDTIFPKTIKNGLK